MTGLRISDLPGTTSVDGNDIIFVQDSATKQEMQATINQLPFASVNAVANKADAGHTHAEATTSQPGFMSPADKAKLDNIVETGSGALLTAEQIAEAYNTQVPEVDKAYAEAGTSTSIFRWSPAQIANAIKAVCVGVLHPVSSGGTGGSTVQDARNNLEVPYRGDSGNDIGAFWRGSEADYALLPEKSPTTLYITDQKIYVGLTVLSATTGSASWENVTGKPTSFPPADHTQAINFGGTGATTKTGARDSLETPHRGPTGNEVVGLWRGTQAEYDALGTYDAKTWYAIV